MLKRKYVGYHHFKPPAFKINPWQKYIGFLNTRLLRKYYTLRQKPCIHRTYLFLQRIYFKSKKYKEFGNPHIFRRWNDPAIIIYTVHTIIYITQLERGYLLPCLITNEFWTFGLCQTIFLIIVFNSKFSGLEVVSSRLIIWDPNYCLLISAVS